MRESIVPAQSLSSSFFVSWRARPEEYFEMLTPGAYTAEGRAPARAAGDHTWNVTLEEGKGSVLTFEFARESIGWPTFSIDAPAGTIVELMVQEHHDPSRAILLNTHYHAWARFTCAGGLNRFATFDYEAVKWLQLHIRGGSGTVTVRDVALRERSYAWKRTPAVATSDATINRVVDAAVNTVNNSVQDRRLSRARSRGARRVNDVVRGATVGVGIERKLRREGVGIHQTRAQGLAPIQVFGRGGIHLRPAARRHAGAPRWVPPHLMQRVAGAVAHVLRMEIVPIGAFIPRRARIGEDQVMVCPVGWTARGYRRPRLCKCRETGRREQRNACERKGEACAPWSHRLLNWHVVAHKAASNRISSGSPAGENSYCKITHTASLGKTSQCCKNGTMHNSNPAPTHRAGAACSRG